LFYHLVTAGVQNINFFHTISSSNQRELTNVTLRGEPSLVVNYNIFTPSIPYVLGTCSIRENFRSSFRLTLLVGSGSIRHYFSYQLGRGKGGVVHHNHHLYNANCVDLVAPSVDTIWNNTPAVGIACHIPILECSRYMAKQRPARAHRWRWIPN